MFPVKSHTDTKKELIRKLIHAFYIIFEVDLSMTSAENTESASLK